MRRPPLTHRLLLGCYPRTWRERYGDELLALMEERRSFWRDLPNLLSGAFDARFKLRLSPAAGLISAVAQPSPSVPPVAPSQALPVDTSARPSYGVAAVGPPIGELSRRGFLRRALGVGVGLLALEFMGGMVSFLWPQIRAGLGAEFRIGTIATVLSAEPRFANGWPYAYNPARIFLVNVPAAMQLALGNDVSMPNPAAGELLALWRKCPHLGCLVPAPCESVSRYQCRCHRSTYNILGEKLHEGPAERGLDRFAVRIERDGTIVVDTAVITRGEPNRGPDKLVFTDPHPFNATCDER